jgi:hypothetical protein
MTEYVIDITLERINKSFSNDLGVYNIFIKIDINGNVDIKQEFLGRRPGYDQSYIHNLLIINDNIPIPSYLINMIKKLFDKNNGLNIGYNQMELNLDHYYQTIDSIRILKNDIANMRCETHF